MCADSSASLIAVGLIAAGSNAVGLIVVGLIAAGPIVVELIAAASNVVGLIAAGLFADLIAAPRSAALKTVAEPQTV